LPAQEHAISLFITGAVVRGPLERENQMSNRLGLIIAIAIAVLRTMFLAKTRGMSAPAAPVSFSERWAPVDEALQSGAFVVKDTAAP
jgi:hypothetical protein